MFKKAMMTLQHINLRREGDEDTAETAVDLKLRGTVLADVQDTLSGGGSSVTLRARPKRQGAEA